MLRARAKALAKRALPKPVFHRLNTLRKQWPLAGARLAFARAGRTPAFLPAKMLPELAAKYPPLNTYRYDPEAKARRGRERAAEIRRLAPHANDFLELGCYDGMVSAHLAEHGAATGVDLFDGAFDTRASKARLLKMDAGRLAFDDASFDVVFSYDTMEHFADAGAVLDEALRVLRPGGVLYLIFGPLYASPRGLHAYRTVTVPYCHLLFDRETLDAYVADIDAKPIAWDAVNGMSVTDFRRLWGRVGARAERTLYEERVDISALDLVRRYPTCMKAATEAFDDLVVSSIEIAFRRR